MYTAYTIATLYIIRQFSHKHQKNDKNSVVCNVAYSTQLHAIFIPKFYLVTLQYCGISTYWGAPIEWARTWASHTERPTNSALGADLPQ